uniref:DNA-directed RNA polymerase RpoA/D/Rpb3-type domain-containing protein n=1 Tax=viral metagenome TaxID=1070528 RepID=A0A6C0FEG1_9ZZZZ|tara:strand:+ start:1804 stop:2952 length:1149 start_codon:yes stop_codon:yes gene_type:complete
MSETKFQLPEVSDQKENNNIYSFRIAKCNVSVINAIRRTLISDVKTVGFKTEPYNEKEKELDSIIIYENTTSFTNEILKQRLACIPVHIKDFEKTPIDDLIVSLDKENKSESIQFITTEDFDITDTKTNRQFSSELKKKIFPQSSITKEHILFARLKPPISKKSQGQKLKFKCKLFVTSAKESGQYNICSTSAYKNTGDKVRQTEEWSKEEEKLKKLLIPQNDIEKRKKNWYILNSQRYFIKDSFDFIVETIGIDRNEELLKKACDILFNSLETFGKKMEEDKFEIITDQIKINNSFDIKLDGYGYTIGKVIEYLLHQIFFKDKKTLSYVGFIKKHPHDDYSIVRLVFTDDGQANIDNIKSLFKTCVKTGQRIFKHINESFI